MRVHLEQSVREAVTEAVRSGALPEPQEPVEDWGFERPADPAHGEWTSTVAMKGARTFRMPPRAIAEAIVAALPDDPAVAEVSIAGPGFINFCLTPAALMSVVKRVRENPETYGRVDDGADRSINVEFVSANPVGPLHVGHGRWAAIGDSLCNVLEYAGWDVTREFYINDAGVQMDTFASSIELRYRELAGEDVDLSEIGYGGSYIIDLAEELFAEHGSGLLDMPETERHVLIREAGYERMLAHIEKTLLEAGVPFDVWTSERTLHEPGADGETAITRAFARLREAGLLFEEEGALWFRSTDFGDDKDRVLVKADGSYTYLAADIAYHNDKFERGAERAIDIWGADHHGYVARMKAACSALGHEGKLEVLLGQLVNLFSGGEAVRMSKRKGTMVTFDELLEEVGRDAARFILVARSLDQEIDFDIDLAKSRTSENPVYYVQYAHARICSVMRKAAAERGVDEAALLAGSVDVSLLTDPSEADLARKLDSFPEVVAGTAHAMAPARLATYATELAAAFHQFYTRCHVITEDAALTDARLALCDATRIVLAKTLSLVGVSAPESM